MTSLDYNETTFFSNQSINNSNITSMSHMRSKSNEKTLKKGGFITDKGFIVYDNIYKDSLRPFLKSKKSKKVKNEELLNIINEFKISKDFNNKEKSAEEEILKRDIVLETRLPTFKVKNQQFKLYKIKKSNSRKDEKK